DTLLVAFERSNDLRLAKSFLFHNNSNLKIFKKRAVQFLGKATPVHLSLNFSSLQPHVKTRRICSKKQN
ncbi:hypothetical protein, partial [Lewinella sp. W8]|uniref:hypothetical protein n=1 Tax=Lewinella sp. W8 TaxID=2528208 RepID=UPI001C12BE42